MNCAGCQPLQSPPWVRAIFLITISTPGSTIVVNPNNKNSISCYQFSGFQLCFHGKVQVRNSNRLTEIRFIKSSVVFYQFCWVRSQTLSGFWPKVYLSFLWNTGFWHSDMKLIMTVWRRLNFTLCLWMFSLVRNWKLCLLWC